MSQLSPSPKQFLEPIVSNLKNKTVIVNDVERCSYFENYETNWDGTSSGVPIYCNGELIRLENGDVICEKCYNRHLVFLYLTCRLLIKSKNYEKDSH